MENMLACLIIFGKVDQSLFPRKDIVSIPYVVVCTFGSWGSYFLHDSCLILVIIVMGSPKDLRNNLEAFKAGSSEKIGNILAEGREFAPCEKMHIWHRADFYIFWKNMAKCIVTCVTKFNFDGWSFGDILLNQTQIF